MTVGERRSARRFRMRLPLSIRWTDGSAAGEALSVSKDVSSRGLSFLLSKPIESGSLVEIVMTLPHEVTLAGPVRVRCLGRILRNQTHEGASFQVAAAIDRYEFLRADQ
ncbi:MAG TPA: PilZ domain-containing protein [Candidatus Acidoferrales bacterium]|nr:PilZ domain-containing protein [Candidatus Acidoferrales bacterium]